MNADMNMKYKTTLLAVVIATIIGSALIASTAFTATVNAESVNNNGLSKGASANFPPP